jgi:hypothetical protein
MRGSLRSRGGRSRTAANRAPPHPYSGSDTSTAAAATGGYDSPLGSARLFEVDLPALSPRPQLAASGAHLATPSLLRVCLLLITILGPYYFYYKNVQVVSTLLGYLVTESPKQGLHTRGCCTVRQQPRSEELIGEVLCGSDVSVLQRTLWHSYISIP